MIDQKRKKNKLKIAIFSLLIFFSFSNVYPGETNCKKFDIKCKSKNWLQETKEFQKKKYQEGKDQLGSSKKQIIDALPKKNNVN